MKRKQPSRQDLLASCEAIGPEDGVDPRTVHPSPAEKKTRRKTLQLCAVVAKALGHALAWELGDDLLGGLVVTAVEPAPNAGRLLVTVSSSEVAADAVLARLRLSTGRLRAAVAAALHRRRVPELAFRVDPGR